MTNAKITFNEKFLLSLPILFLSLLSVYLGQDANWDYRNYHFYNAWSFLNNRLTIDFAPSQMQTFFNPLMDVPHYLLTTYFGARSASLFYGFIHALAIIPVYRIAVLLLGRSGAYTISIICLGSAIFLYQLGSTVGDNSSGVLMLFSILYGIKSIIEEDDQKHEFKNRSILNAAISGFFSGSSVGLKLTNAPFGIAIVIALMFAKKRHTGVALSSYIVAALVAFMLLAGFWYIKVWQDFGNPFFPQFNNFFKSPLASEIGVIDTRWVPKSFTESVMWPFLMQIRPYLVGEGWHVSFFMPLLYVAVLIGCIGMLVCQLNVSAYYRLATTVVNRQLLIFVLSFSCISYLLWMKLFSVGRYMMVLEILAPIFTLFIINVFFGKFNFIKYFILLILSCSFFICLYNLKSSGRSDYTKDAFSVNFPVIKDVNKSFVIFTGGNPLSWIAPHLDHSLFFTYLNGNFPESFAYKKRVMDIIERRSGSGFLVIGLGDSSTIYRYVNISSILPTLSAIIASFQFTNLSTCDFIKNSLGIIFYSKDIKMDIANKNNKLSCSFSKQPNVITQDNDGIILIDKADNYMSQLNLLIERPQCKVYTSSIGQANFDYIVCPIHLKK